MELEDYLQASNEIDWHTPTVLALAQELALATKEISDQAIFEQHITALAKTCFEWVRDEIHHSVDYQMNPVTCKASDVLKYGTGYCFAKSHLLAALLRANQIPTGFCYQRLSINDQGAPYSLHGFNAIHLPEIGWYRVDPRGNRAGIDAQFVPPQEQLAFPIRRPKEATFKTIFPEPLPIVVSALRSHQTWDDMLNHLPDLTQEQWQNYQLSPRTKI